MPTPPGGAAPAGETARILKIAGALLADEAAWDRSPIRTDDPVNGRHTPYSALATACHQVTGRYSHRHPALDAVRAEIQDGSGTTMETPPGRVQCGGQLRRCQGRADISARGKRCLTRHQITNPDCNNWCAVRSRSPRLADRAAGASGHQVQPARCAGEPAIAGSMCQRAGRLGGSGPDDGT
jgi:hypothetical protein